MADARKRHECTPEDYIGNATTQVMAPLLNRDSLGLGQSSLTIRHAIQEQTESAELARIAYLVQSERERTGVELVCAVPGTIQTFCSNWTRMKLLELDFSGAISEEKTGRQERKCVNPQFIGTHWRANSNPMRNQLYILGRDMTGGYWLHARVPTGDLKRFKNQIEAST